MGYRRRMLGSRPSGGILSWNREIVITLATTIGLQEGMERPASFIYLFIYIFLYIAVVYPNSLV